MDIIHHRSLGGDPDGHRKILPIKYRLSLACKCCWTNSRVAVDFRQYYAKVNLIFRISFNKADQLATKDFGHETHLICFTISLLLVHKCHDHKLIKAFVGVDRCIVFLNKLHFFTDFWMICPSVKFCWTDDSETYCRNLAGFCDTLMISCHVLRDLYYAT